MTRSTIRCSQREAAHSVHREAVDCFTLQSPRG